MAAQDMIYPLHETDLNRLLSAHDGDIALLYLYRLRHPDASQEQAAFDLCRTMDEISRADEKLSRMVSGIVSPVSETKPAPAEPEKEPVYSADTLPQYTKDEICRRGNASPDFKAILDEAKRITGSLLSENYMRTLFGIYDYLAMPAEVILELLNYVNELVTARTGGHRRPSARDVEREAFHWYNNGIVTLEAAEEYIARQHERSSEVGRVRAVLNISGRALSPSESKYLNSWLDKGFSPDAIAIAYDRTLVHTGSLKWSYMDRILSSWDEKKLHTPEEIQAGDGRTKPSSRTNTPTQEAPNIDELRKLYENI